MSSQPNMVLGSLASVSEAAVVLAMLTMRGYLTPEIVVILHFNLMDIGSIFRRSAAWDAAGLLGVLRGISPLSALPRGLPQHPDIAPLI
jgi:hypothetical protein